MRARNIKPGFFTNDTLALCSPIARLLFAGLWTIADRAGRLEDRPRRIKAEVLPYDDCDPDALLEELRTQGFIIRYSNCVAKYIQVVNFEKHQNPHVKEPPSSIPAPDKNSASTVQERDSNESGTEVATLIPDSGFRIPDSIVPLVTENISQPSVAVETKAPTAKKKERGAEGATLPDWVPADVWRSFREHRVSLRKRMTARAEVLLLRDLEKIVQTTGADPAEIIEQSIKNGWQGIFELKRTSGNGNGQPQHSSAAEREAARRRAVVDKLCGREGREGGEKIVRDL